VLCLLSYVRERDRTRHVPGTVPRSCLKEPPAGIEPAPRPYKGRVLAVDTTEALMETVGVEPTFPRCKRGALPPELRPQVDANGWSRTTKARGTAFTAQRALQCSASAREGRPAGFEPEPRGSRPRMLAVTPRPPREAGTTGLEPADLSPDKRLLLPLSYVPR
jgi:hypothetical protein